MTSVENGTRPSFGGLTLVITSLVVGAGCDCATTAQTLNPDRKVAGYLTYQPPGASPAMDDLGAAFFSVLEDPSGSPNEVAFTLAPASARGMDPAPFWVWFVVDFAPRVASQELDLTGENASVTAFQFTPDMPIRYHGVRGHLSLQGIDPTCRLACPFRIHGTVAVSATGPNDETFALTSATFRANDTVSEQRVCPD
jgi:hypothetical protein